MYFEDRQIIEAPREELWDFLMQIEKVGECIPGCDRVVQVGPEEYETTMRLRVGPINLRVESKLHVVERDRDTWTATMRANGAERGVGGGVNATFTMVLSEVGDGKTELLVKNDAKILGRLGEFGQPVMKRKAASITQQFASTIGKRLADERAATR